MTALQEVKPLILPSHCAVLDKGRSYFPFQLPHPSYCTSDTASPQMLLLCPPRCGYQRSKGGMTTQPMASEPRRWPSALSPVTHEWHFLLVQKLTIFCLAKITSWPTRRTWMIWPIFSPPTLFCHHLLKDEFVTKRELTLQTTVLILMTVVHGFTQCLWQPCSIQVSKQAVDS